jgi:predicted phage terminase large subunit-like protein
MAALQYVDIPGYSAILFRQSYSDLILPGALMDRARDWLSGNQDVIWRESEKTYHFPSSATLSFGYISTDADVYRYQSAEFQMIGFDELTQFDEFQYRYLFSRLRRLKNIQIPLRMRTASNPGGLGHDWVKRRLLIEGRQSKRVFIPAKLDDNPYLDRDAYVKSLMNLDPVTRLQYLNGDWSARSEGSLFKREWFKIVDAAPAGIHWVRRWDLAATEKVKGGDPDWTAGCKMGRTQDGKYYIADMRRLQGSPQTVEKVVLQTAQLDGLETTIYVEQEPGAGGKSLIDYYIRQLAGFQVYPDRPATDKLSRAAPLSSQAEAGNVYLVNGSWISEMLDEFDAFPQGSHDDQVDAASGAYSQLIVPSSFDTWREVIRLRKEKEKENA